MSSNALDSILGTFVLGLVFASTTVHPKQPRRDKLAPVDSLMRPGVSAQLAAFRVKTVSQVRYDLALDVTSLDSAVGDVAVGFVYHGPGDAILDFRGRRLLRASVNGTALPGTSFNGSHLRLPASALREGENSAEFGFVADIAPSGASIIRVHDTSDDSDYLYTLFVPADANQLFPCFDQPDIKARVAFALTTSRSWNALANGSIASADTIGDRVTFRFKETQPISTYLIAFAAGPWERASSTVGGRSISLLMRRSRAAEVEADSLLAMNHRALNWMERYFDRPFPFEKFDFVLAPAFPFGGMEHPGAVFYNENSFIFRDRPTLPRRLRRSSTIFHEVAHEWFGDLVTMRWFDDLWLKEGFATYMAAKALADLDSTRAAWQTFYQDNKPAAYDVDQTTGTVSLWQELANLDQAKSAYGAIVYNKAPGVLKQLNYLVGESAFQAGVRDFLRMHAYGNATWRDLLESVGRVASRPLDNFGRNFVLRPGMPTVQQRVTVHDGKIRNLELVQRPAKPLSGTRPWPMRTQVLLAYGGDSSISLPVELEKHITEVSVARGWPAPTFVFSNLEDYGYFLPILDTASIRALTDGALGAVRDSFLRAMLWDALWFQVRDARMEPARFSQLLFANLPLERDEQVVPRLLGYLERTLRAYVPPSARSRLAFEAERVLWAAAADTSRPYGLRKPFLDAFVRIALTPDGISKLETLLKADSAAGDGVRDPTRWSVVERLLMLGSASAEAALKAQSARDSTPDGRRRAFVAGAARRSATNKREYFRRYFQDRTLNEDWASGSLAAFNATEHETLTLPYLRPALDSLSYILSNRRIFFLGSWLGAFLDGQGSEEALKSLERYLADKPKLARDLRQKVLQSSDELARTVRIRKKWRGTEAH